MYCDRIENFASGEINERNFSNPHPSSAYIHMVSSEIIFQIQPKINHKGVIYHNCSGSGLTLKQMMT